MARSERVREIARRRKRMKERKKLRARGLLPPIEALKEGEVKKPKKASSKDVSKPVTGSSSGG